MAVNIYKQYRDKSKQADKELNKQIIICNAATALALHNEPYNFGRKRIKKVMEYVDLVYKELGEYGVEKSSCELLDEETDLVLSLEGEKPYYEYDFLNYKMWDGHQPTIPQQIYILEQQIKWMPTVVIAAMLVAVHRVYGFGVRKRLPELLYRIDEYRMKCREVDWYQEQLGKILNAEICIDNGEGR